MIDMLYEEVTSPDDWSNFANEVYPGIAQAVDEESRQIKNITRKANLKRRLLLSSLNAHYLVPDVML